MSATNKIKGGAFQDLAGNPLKGGYLILKIAHQTFWVWLDQAGSVSESPVVPTGIYSATVHTADGTAVWGPHIVSVNDSPSPFNISIWLS